MLQRALSIWGPCEARGGTAPTGSEGGRLLVVDLDLSGRGAVETARHALAPHRRAGTPSLFLLRDSSAHCLMQANALGARETLPADAPPALLLDTVGAMLGLMGEAGEGARIERHFVAASAALADLLDAAGSGGRLPITAINDSIEALNRAADGGDLNAWLDMVWRHDDATYQHCLLVSGIAAAFAQRLGFREADRRLITGAAVLHDVGKARIPLDILHKPGRLTAAEWEVVQRHPQIGHDMLVAEGGFDPMVLAVALSHHEHLDGSGYPHGLRGAQIPDPVRMITICDIYAALIERRAYKQPMPPEEAYAVLVEMQGKLDRDLVRVFGDVVLAGSIARLGRYRASAPGRGVGKVA